MKIQSITVSENKKPFNFNFTSAHIDRNQPDSLIISFEFDNGLLGLGETTPRAYVTGETCLTVARAFQECFAPALFSADIESFEDVSLLMGALEKLCTGSDFPHCNCALTAVELALMDGLGKYLGVSTGSFLGPVVRESVPYALSVPFMTLEQIERTYPVFEPFNIGFLKAVVGHDNEYNIEKLKLIRSLVGDDPVVLLEANGHLSLDEAITLCRLAEPYNITGFEQPLPAGELEGLIELKKKTGIPIILDESICNSDDARRFLDNDAVDIVNIKIAKCGGLVQSCQIAELTRRYDKVCHLGAHVGETAILTAAGLHFGMTIPNIRFFEGFSFMLFQELNETPAAGKLAPERLMDIPGIGLTQPMYDQILQDCREVALIKR